VSSPGKPGGRRKPGAHRGRLCSVCAHPECGRIDYLLVSGAGEWGRGRRALAEKFGLGENSIWNHSKNHISAEYRKAVLAGPFRSEDDLRQLVAEEGQSVIVNFRSIFNGHRQRWLAAMEGHNDAMMIKHAACMGELLWKIAKITHEVPPPVSLVQNNMSISLAEHPEYVQSITALVEALRPYPEARLAAAAALRGLDQTSEKPKLIEAAD
jgi:hypothetical protein